MDWIRRLFGTKPESEEAQLTRLNELQADLTARRLKFKTDGEARAQASAASDVDVDDSKTVNDYEAGHREYVWPDQEISPQRRSLRSFVDPERW
jgi:hypothetical protein